MRRIFKIINGRLYYISRVKRRKVASSATRRRGGKRSLNYIKYKKDAATLVKERLEHFNTFYNFKYGRVAIRNQKTRWGSCSKKGNLNFNYKIVLLTSKQANYIIVHELCHLKEFNHSQRFWDLVAKVVPDYKEVRSSLRTNGLHLR
ncbi:M48 family metallopeptidase [Candidatus Nomurabacteria bacterium]|nr:M48 family metallopeptidase [Candidatus Nomurabacteria bacterium]